MSTDPRAYGRSFADVYDAWYHDVSDLSGTLAVVERFAGDGPVVELGSGTGRLARPLADAGRQVVGVDASAEMHARLRAAMPVDDIEVSTETRD